MFIHLNQLKESNKINIFVFWCICDKKKTHLYNKRACPQTMFKILHLQKQRCQIEEGNRVANKILDLSYFINSLRDCG